MKISVLFFALFHSLMFVTQEPPLEYNIYSASLCSGDKLHFGNKAVEFKKVIEDSRCPSNPGITCIWEGEVKVLVEFYENGKSKGEKLISNSGISIAEYFNTEELNINGFVVSPYPESWKKIKPEDYRLSLEVAEKVLTEN